MPVASSPLRLASCRFSFDGETTAIEQTATQQSQTVAACYSLNGQQLSSLKKGLNIVKYADGSVRKIKN